MKIEKFFNTPEKRARLLKWAWLISFLMLAFGYAMMLIFWGN
jgi:hypothetical protein